MMAPNGKRNGPPTPEDPSRYRCCCARRLVPISPLGDPLPVMTMLGFERFKHVAGVVFVAEVVAVSDRSDAAVARLDAPCRTETLQPKIASLILTKLAIPPALQ